MVTNIVSIRWRKLVPTLDIPFQSETWRLNHELVNVELRTGKLLFNKILNGYSYSSQTSAAGDLDLKEYPAL